MPASMDGEKWRNDECLNELRINEWSGLMLKDTVG